MSKHPTPTDDRASKFTLGQLISALDDRNILRAMRVLEPADGAEPSSRPDERDGRCVRCITRGE
jgi:hypothetical protein